MRRILMILSGNRWRPRVKPGVTVWAGIPAGRARNGTCPPSLEAKLPSNIRRAFLALIYSLSFLCIQTYAATFTANLDRNTINKGETVNLTLSLDELSTQSPDIKTLRAMFVVFGRSRSESIQSINGKQTTSTHWAYTLYPRTTGELHIPEFHFQQLTTKPLMLTVKKPLQNTKQQSIDGKPVYLQTEVSPQSPFINAEVHYVVRVFSAINLLNAHLEPPVADHTTFLQAGDDRTYQTEKNGMLYEVLERRYAAFPQKAGELVIQAPILEGSIKERFQHSGFSRLKPMQVSTSNETLHVKAMPASLDADTWLPAQRVTVSQTWDQSLTKLQSGTPFTRTITITAAGLPASDIPAVTQDTLPNVQSYPDKPMLKDKSQSGNIIGRRTEKFAYLPTQAGTLSLPAINIPWWNTITNKKEIARLPAETLRIQGQVTVKTKILDNKPTPEKILVKAPQAKWVMPLWKQSAIGSGILIFIFLGLWFSRRKNNTKPVSNNKTKSAIKLACVHNDARATKAALLAWARLQWPEKPCLSLTDLAKRMPTEALNNAVQTLDQQLYGKLGAHFEGKILWRLFNAVKWPKPSSEDKSKPDLPPLYKS